MILKKLLCSTLLILSLSNCCGDPEVVCQKVTSGFGEVIDPSGNIIAENEHIPYGNYKIKTSFEFESTVCQNRERVFIKSPTCDQDIAEYRTNLISIKITSNSDYNANFPKDKEITDLFEMQVVNANCFDDSTQLSHCVSETDRKRGGVGRGVVGGVGCG